MLQAFPSRNFGSFRRSTGAGIIQIICNADTETLFRRFSERARSRSRHPGHGDEAVLDELRANLAQESSPNMNLDGHILLIDTTDFTRLDYRAIANQVRTLMAAGSASHIEVFPMSEDTDQ